ncbi:MAG: undecaprenyl-diphosphate phosphatase [Phycisphaerales bacterium]|nr:undecaprenyl-diphosphate phosphatase [Phycisphaerales bacterium]
MNALDALRAIVLGIVEGLTEFLPVSSTGHMILAQPLLGINPDEPRWRILLIVSQLGAILAVVFHFRRDLWARLAHRPARGGVAQHLVVKLALGVAPAMLVGYLAHDVIEERLERPLPVAAALIVGAGAMLLIDRRFRNETPMTLDDVTLRQAAAIGAIQCVSMWPGVSRAAATIMGGMVVGLSPEVSARFSFYLAIPTMFAAGGYQLLKYRADLTAETVGLVAVGSATAFVVALGVINVFLRFVQHRRFTAFAVYRFVLGLAVLGMLLSS